MAQKFGQVTIAPLQRYGSQPGSPGVPSSLGTHMPTLPITLQASQALMGQAVKADTSEGGAHATDIAVAVAAALDRAVAAGLPQEAVPRAQGFSRELRRSEGSKGGR